MIRKAHNVLWLGGNLTPSQGFVGWREPDADDGGGPDTEGFKASSQRKVVH
jgi:hypothetical protein